MELNVWILVMEWEDGSSARAFSTQPEAYEWLDAYVREQWDEGSMGDEEYPGDVDVARELYYDAYDHENWTLDNQKVSFPDLVLPDDEVTLTPEECEVVTESLKQASIVKLAIALDWVADEVDVSLTAAYEKLKD